MKYKEIDVIKASKEHLILAGTKHILEYVKNEFNKFQQKGLITTDISLKAVYFDYVPIATILALDSLYSYSVVWATTEEFAKQIQIKSKAIIDSYVDYSLSPSFHSEIIKDPILDSEFGSPIISVYPHTNIMDISHELFKDTKISLENVCVNIDSRIKNLSEIVNKQWIDGAYYWNYKSTLKYNEYKQNIDNYIFKTKDPKIVAGLTHYLYDRYLLSDDSADETIYFNIPIIGANVDSLEIEFKGQAVAFCYLVFENPNKLNITDYICNFAKHISPVIDYNIKNVIFNLLYGVTSKLQERIKKESLKSAVSAIMTRNMSHNLGSHYLHYTKSHLEQLAKQGGDFGPDIRGAARVMGYMQGRMDYLATLISMDRYPYGCVNFKSQIFDELTIDDFSKRHFERNLISNDDVRNVILLLKILQKEDNKREIVKANLESLYELSKKALSNKSHNRTTNFLLSNLILSENFTRPDILNDNSSCSSDVKMINLQVLLDLKDNNEESYTKVFTGSLAKKDDEEIVKRKLSEVNIALPGGLMSSHAFFNIVENFIRNSAKYLQSDFDKDGNLTITIKITEINGYYEFTIFDNKQNANKNLPDTNNSLLGDLLNKISNLCILDDNNALDKKDKGFKEMLFSAMWLRSYMYQNISDNDLPQSYEEVLVKIESVNKKERLKLIKDYGFELLAVDDNGNESKEDNANLALRLSLPKFCPKTMMGLSDNALQVNLSNLLHIYADVAMIDAEQYTSFVKQLNEKRRTDEKDIYEEDMIIPRLLKHKKGLSNVEALNEVLHDRFGNDFDNYQITSGTSTDNLSTVLADNKKIYFQRHLSTQDVIDHYKGYAYADSVSGGNYTITLFDIYERWAKEGRDPKSEDYYQILKIKESALTRITIIDERFFKKMKEQHLETELACKNIRVLNYNDSMSEKTEIADLLEGNEFNNHVNDTHFLSIHLGVIEKIIKNVDMFKKIEKNNEKVRLFMKMLKEYFGSKVFISIHSGRGNFSAELEDALDMYPFISMAALENAYENSKYLLAQLFYSTIYIGKGVANHDN